VSHADCEDLADRIRAIRTDRGELGGESIDGPGWGPEPRHYVAGDRVLLHARVGRGPDRLNNGTEATVRWVGSEGLAVLTDDGREAVLAREFVEGRRRDANPNLSHAWARTVDGCQGGTWAQVHLLGNGALDNFSAYVGQSRSQHPTHTWNVTPVIGTDFGGALADRRSPDEVVLAAMGRVPLKTFAFTDDPWVPDRRLRAEIAEHQEVIATRPPDRTQELEAAKEALTRAGHELKDAHAFFAGASRRLDAIGPVSRLRRDGRQAHARASAEVERAGERLEHGQHQVLEGRGQVRALERDVSQRGQWDAQHGWRLEEVTRIQGELSRHWAGVTLGAVREGDPLAFGIERLRAARATYASELQGALDALPPDRSRQLGHAKRDLDRAGRRLSGANQELDQALAVEVAAYERHWGRRDKGVMASASSRVERARERVATSAEELSGCGRILAGERKAANVREAALRATAPQRDRLETVVAELDQALDTTRTQRVLNLAFNPELPQHLHATLGPLPQSRGGRRVWCALASEIEEHRDRGADGPGSTTSLGADLDRWSERAHWSFSAPSIEGRASRLLEMGAQLDPRPPGDDVLGCPWP